MKNKFFINQIAKKVLLFFLVFLGFFSININEAFALECQRDCVSISDAKEKESCSSEKIKCLEEKVKEKQGEKDTLSNAINTIDSKIQLQEAQIEKTRFEQLRLEKEVEVLADRIENLADSLVKLTDLLRTKIKDDYKMSKRSPLTLFLEADSFGDYIAGQQQEKTLRSQISKVMFKAMDKKVNYNDQIGVKEKGQEELKVKKKELAAQQIKLEEQKVEKNVLLAQTRNDEKQYQKLLEQARTEIDSYARFASSQGGGTCIGASQSSDDGWFYSQRDPRWCKQYIGKSNMTVGQVGCLMTSSAMIMSKYGQTISPASMAANNRYFLSNTAFMLDPPVPTGLTYKRLNYMKAEEIDKEVEAGRPVIVHVKTNNGYGGHFVVIKEKKDGKYIMHDPWNGPDLEFTKYYGLGSIDSMRIFTK